MLVSVVIKAFNEEKHIGAAIESAIAAVAPHQGEVVIADAGSTDRTVAVASRYPVRIVQLARPDERSCGATAQLGYQHSAGAFVYLLDGDMTLNGEFLSRALAFLQRNPDVAGVGGSLREMNVYNLEFARRSTRRDAHLMPGDVDRLDGGGLYRQAAIDSVGYLADRNLHAYEELDLGVRLRTSGWRLVRLDLHATTHYAHRMKSYPLLWRRVRSGYAWATGEVLRGAFGRPHFWATCVALRELRIWVGVIAWWAALAVSFLAVSGVAAAAAATAALLIGPVLALSVWRRSVASAVYSVVSWNVYTAGMIRGAFRRRVSPRPPVPAVVLREGVLLADPSGAALTDSLSSLAGRFSAAGSR
jgi:glycosyltransferase involved in cell wall biosynthesis